MRAIDHAPRLGLSQAVAEAMASKFNHSTATEAVYCNEQLGPTEFRRLIQELFDGLRPAISKQMEEM
jgi:hypothetical protein